MGGLAIKAAGMVTAVGFNHAASCAAIRAGVRNVNQTNLWDIESGTYLVAGRVLLPHWWVGAGKLVELVAPAIRECLVAAQPVSASSIPILLGISAPSRPFRPPDLEAVLLSELSYKLGFQLHQASRVIPHDHISVLTALAEANQLLEGRSIPFCVVAAVDSLIQQDLVEYYLGNRRILTPNNSNGFSPGEAGSAVLVGQPSDSPNGEMRILSIATARESATIESDEPCRGEGLAEAIGKVLRGAGLKIEGADFRITDLNGEHYKFKEMTFALMKYERRPREKLFDLWHPIEYFGDVGAAIGPILLGLALHASRKGYGIGPTILTTLANDDGARGAMLLRFSSS